MKQVVLKNTARIAALVGVMGLLGAASATSAQGPVDYSLSRMLSQTATRAEASSKASDRISLRMVVEPALQQVVINSGDTPAQVRVSLEHILQTCRTIGTGAASSIGDLSCPGRQGSYDAISNLLNVVVALINTNEEPAGGDIGWGGPPYAGPLGVLTAANGQTIAGPVNV